MAARVTAPSRIPHGEAVRNAVRVEWMRLDSDAAVDQALAWLEAHGVKAYRVGRGLWITTENGDFLPAPPGRVLVLVPESGEFSVWDWERFVVAHPGVEA